MTEPSSNPPPRDRGIAGWLLLPLSLFPLVALITYDWHAMPSLMIPPQPSTNWVGALGDWFAYYGYLLFGLSVWAVPAFCIVAALARLTGRSSGGLRRLWLLAAMAALSCLLQVAAPHAPPIAALLVKINLPDAGGAVGHLVMTRLLSPLLSDFGASVLILVALVFAVVAAIGLKALAAFFVSLYNWAVSRDAPPEPPTSGDKADEARYVAEQAQYLAALKAKDDAKRQKEEEKAAAKAAKEAQREAVRLAKEAAKAARAAERSGQALPPPAPAPAPQPLPAPAPKAPAKAKAAAALQAPEGEVEDKGPYMLPSTDLLNPLKISSADHSDVGEMKQRLVDTLKLFGIDATVAYDVQGPVVTKYALSLAPGTRYSAVTNISDNLMGALRAKSLRIEAPIPGEDHIGVEVPNAKPAGISFREIFESDAWKNFKGELPLLFGKDAAGHELVADLASMPHMLVAGATGQGKSVCLNAIINGLLMTRTPEQLKLIMVDPKSVEFTSYASIPHLIVPIITENRKAATALMWAVAEMEKRLKLFARAKVRNIRDFNHRPSFTQTDMFGNDTEVGADMPKTVPYVVVIIDEVADLMSQCAKEVVPHISRLTAKARAAGIHLILATQRPDAKVITGTIKANIPGRVAFKTATSIDSRTILDDGGAENLIGRGDMLFKSKEGLLIRAQGAWISDEEIARITAFIEQHANTQFDEKFKKNLDRIKDQEIDPFAELNAEDAAAAEKENASAQREQVKAAANADDFKKAVECVINTKRASTSHFQRQMGWGYNHAAKILDMLTERGIVSAPQGMGPRQIIMDQDQLVAILNGDSPAEIAEDAAADLADAGEAGENQTASPTPVEDDGQPNLFTEELT